MPSASTLFRFSVVDAQSEGTLNRLLSRVKPLFGDRDKDRVSQIERASTAQELIDLVTAASGLAEDAWHKRMREFGAEVLPLISERLRTVKRVRDTDEHATMYENFIADLRWRGDAGADVLLECFDALEDYGKCLACVVLGLLKTQCSADKMWDFFTRARHSRGEHLFVGALWGLTDLKDERVSSALVEFLRRKRAFYELFGFFSLAGAADAIRPLLLAADQLPEHDKLQALMAVISVAHRIGRQALIAELARDAPADEPGEALATAADLILSRPASQAQEFFGIFYRGFTPGDLKTIMGGA